MLSCARLPTLIVLGFVLTIAGASGLTAYGQSRSSYMSLLAVRRQVDRLRERLSGEYFSERAAEAEHMATDYAESGAKWWSLAAYALALAEIRPQAADTLLTRGVGAIRLDDAEGRRFAPRWATLAGHLGLPSATREVQRIAEDVRVPEEARDNLLYWFFQGRPNEAVLEQFARSSSPLLVRKVREKREAQSARGRHPGATPEITCRSIIEGIRSGDVEALDELTNLRIEKAELEKHGYLQAFLALLEAVAAGGGERFFLLDEFAAGDGKWWLVMRRAPHAWKLSLAAPFGTYPFESHTSEELIDWWRWYNYDDVSARAAEAEALRKQLSSRSGQDVWLAEREKVLSLADRDKLELLVSSSTADRECDDLLATILLNRQVPGDFAEAAARLALFWEHPVASAVGVARAGVHRGLWSPMATEHALSGASLEVLKRMSDSAGCIFAGRGEASFREDVRSALGRLPEDRYRCEEPKELAQALAEAIGKKDTEALHALSNPASKPAQPLDETLRDYWERLNASPLRPKLAMLLLDMRTGRTPLVAYYDLVAAKGHGVSVVFKRECGIWYLHDVRAEKE